MSDKRINVENTYDHLYQYRTSISQNSIFIYDFKRKNSYKTDWRVLLNLFSHLSKIHTKIGQRGRDW